MTLIEQWNFYHDIIKNREEQYLKEIVDKLLQGVIPQKVYEVWGIQGKIIEKEITGIIYINGKYFSYNKRPTRLMVNEIKSFAESDQQLTSDNVYLRFVQKYVSHTSSGSFKINTLAAYILTKEKAEEVAKPLVEKYAAEEEMIRTGTHIRCQRCQKIVANADVVNYKIISFATYGSAGKQMKFCSGICAGHEQMAHEG